MSTELERQLEVCRIALREMFLAGEAYRLAAANHLGISITDSQAISYLMARGPMEQHELATAMGMTTGSITTLMDRLTERGLVERRPHDTDRRRSIAQISDEGVRVLDQVRHQADDVFLNVDRNHLPELARTLNSLAVNLRARAAEVPENTTATTGSRRVHGRS